jgi:hypothetical protein
MVHDRCSTLLTGFSTALTTILPILFQYCYECCYIWYNPPFLWKCLYQVRVITVFPVFRLLTDFVCLYTYEFWLSLSTKIYDKRDDFNFKIIDFPNMYSNIPASPAYGVYISQLIRYARASSNYSDFLKPWNVIFIWETGYWTRAITRLALFDLLKSLYSDTKILSKYIPSLQKRL